MQTLKPCDIATSLITSFFTKDKGMDKKVKNKTQKIKKRMLILFQNLLYATDLSILQSYLDTPMVKRRRC